MQLQRLLIQHPYGDGSSPPSRFRDDGYGKDDDEIPSSVATEKETLILYVENDIDFEPKSTSVLGPAKAKPSESSDEERFFCWFIFQQEKRDGTTIKHLLRDKLSHVRDHAGVRKAADLLKQMSKDARKYFVVALDTEGIELKLTLPSMLQLSARVGEKEFNAVFQIRSEMVSHNGPIRHILQEGTPVELAKVFCLKNIIFSGKDIKSDIEKVTPALGLSADEVNDLLLIETSRVFGFVYALAKGGGYLNR